MRVRIFLIFALIILTMPCMELPEWAGMYDDASNDFVIAPAKTELPAHARPSATHLPARHVNRRTPTAATTTSFISASVPNETDFLSNLVAIQKK